MVQPVVQRRSELHEPERLEPDPRGDAGPELRGRDDGRRRHGPHPQQTRGARTSAGGQTRTPGGCGCCQLRQHTADADYRAQGRHRAAEREGRADGQEQEGREGGHRIGHCFQGPHGIAQHE